ncbi:MAG TPA: carboxypeptidase regulatory-like domain-containing protein, partial [Pyrinomonadaceae bacterium]|nr:carboxypeptidase regulatory-like domain-containing protein [Pyrinomonadaceae bacterium]
MNLRIKEVCRAAVLILFLSFAAAAQQPSGSVAGVVKDLNGNVISGVLITLKSESNGQSRSVVSGADGRYQFASIVPGRYSIRFEARGFKRSVVEGVTLSVGQNVVQSLQLEVDGPEETVILDGNRNYQLVETGSTKVDSVIRDFEVENYPLNGRNFLELALLTPGNTIAPNFDPTKTNTVVISSAGQVGRGGSVTVDGADNNDDVVGGSLINIPQDAVQEFQVATNRFSAQYGRTGSGLINVVTKGGSNVLRGSASFFARDKVLQGLPATFDRSLESPPFDRQQYAFTLGGPFIKDKFFGFGAVEYRDQDGATLVGIRDVPNRVIRSGFAEAPLKDLLLTTRFDIYATEKDKFGFNYSFQDADARDSSKLDRAIGSASYLQELKNRFHSAIGNWSRVFSPTVVADVSLSFNNFANTTDPIEAGRQLTFPSILDGTSFRVPQATDQNRIQFGGKVTA